MNVEYSQGVFEELVGISFYLADFDENAAHRFLDACEQTFGILAADNLIGSYRVFENSRLKDVRIWRVKGFSDYLIFYLPLESGVKILHVIHGSRDYCGLFEREP